MSFPPKRAVALTMACAFATLVSVACSGSDEGAEVPASAPIVETPTATAEPGPEPTAEPAVTEPTTPATAAPEPAGLTDDCVQGEWVMDAADTANLVAVLLPGFPLVVDGTMAMTFEGESAEHYINVVVTFTLPNGTVSGALDQRFAGTFLIDGDELAIVNDSIEGGWSNLTGTLSGVAVDVPAPPTGDLPALTGGPATCTDTELTIGYTSGLADAVARFTRV